MNGWQDMGQKMIRPVMTDGFLKAGVFSLLLHLALAIFLSLNVTPAGKERLSVQRVTLRPFSSLGNGSPLGNSGSGGSITPGGSSAPPAAENMNPGKTLKEGKGGAVQNPTPERKSSKKPGKDLTSLSDKREKLQDSYQPGKKEGLSEKGKRAEKIQEALEDVRKRAAIEEIQKRVAQRERVERVEKGRQPSRSQTTGEGKGSDSPSGSVAGFSGTRLQGSAFPPSKGLSSSGSGSGVTTGPGSATGSGSTSGAGRGGSPTGGSPWGSSSQGSSYLESKRNEYYSLIWAKIKEEWTLPEDFQKEKTDLETIIVMIVARDGKVQKSWFEKRSGNFRYDQRAMRAITKAAPLPPIPKEFEDDSVEIAFRFHPD